MSDYITSDTITVAGTIFVVAITWALNEKSKRAYSTYLRKEERYVALIDNLRGFYDGSKSKEQTGQFLDQINRCWLYCPDEVIKKGYAFLGKMHVTSGAEFTSEEREAALAELIVEIRKDLLSKKYLFFPRTKLKAEDFKHLAAN